MPTKQNNLRKRTFQLILYPDNELHKELLDRIINNEYAFDYAGILHNKDINNDGEYKKAHYHVVLHLKEACTRTALAKNLGIEERFVEIVKNYTASLQYLIHYKQLNKAQYSVENVFGTLADKVKELTSKMSETEQVNIIINTLNNIESKIDIATFMLLCNEKGCYSGLRRNQLLFIKAIEQHNSKY